MGVPMPHETKQRLKTVAFLVLSLAGTQVSSPDVRLAMVIAAGAVLWFPDGRPRRSLTRTDRFFFWAAVVALVMAVVSRFVEVPEAVERPMMWAMAVVLVLVMLVVTWQLFQFVGLVGSSLRQVRAMGRDMETRHPEMAAHIDAPGVRTPRRVLARWLFWGRPPWRRPDVSRR